jgi:hypothetical protein
MKNLTATFLVASALSLIGACGQEGQEDSFEFTEEAGTDESAIMAVEEPENDLVPYPIDIEYKCHKHFDGSATWCEVWYKFPHVANEWKNCFNVPNPGNGPLACR